MFPTPESVASGPHDWSPFDFYVGQIRASLKADHGLSDSDAEVEVRGFRQYVLGPSGALGMGLYELHGYGTNDRGTATLGQKSA